MNNNENLYINKNIQDNDNDITNFKSPKNDKNKKISPKLDFGVLSNFVSSNIIKNIFKNKPKFNKNKNYMN